MPIPLRWPLTLSMVSLCQCSDFPERDFPHIDAALFQEGAGRVILLAHVEMPNPAPLERRCYDFIVRNCGNGDDSVLRSCQWEPFKDVGQQTVTLSSDPCIEDAAFPLCGDVTCVATAVGHDCTIVRMRSCEPFQLGINPFGPGAWQ